MFKQCNTSIPLSTIMDSSSKKARKENYTVLKDKRRISPGLTHYLPDTGSNPKPRGINRKLWVDLMILAWLP